MQETNGALIATGFDSELIPDSITAPQAQVAAA